MSFHGVPRYTRSTRATPTTANAKRPAAAGRSAESRNADTYQICFQSRFGPAEWLQALHRTTLAARSSRASQRVDILCPGFPADCLETLEEIAMEGKSTFLTGWRQGVPLHPLPERARRLDKGPDSSRRQPSARLADEDRAVKRGKRNPGQYRCCRERSDAATAPSHDRHADRP
jgi:hypothetical protein